MNVLSLFDGMSCGRIALDRAGIEVNKYYASELDKYAITVTQANWPETMQLGDVTKWREWDIDWSSIDLLIGGSPCQGFSFAGKQLAFDDPRSALFFEYLNILNHIKSVNPEVKFLLENVKMKKEYLDVITEKLGVEPVFCNSSLVSAQERKRYYWANWEFMQPEDKGIVLSDIIESGVVDRDKSFCVDANYWKGGNLKAYFEKRRRKLVFQLSEINPRCVDVSINEDGIRPHRGDARKSGISELGRLVFKDADKTYALTTSHMPKLIDATGYRKLTPIECERLQTINDNYTRTSFFIQNNETSKGIKKCGYVSSKNAISQSQVGKLNSAISTILDSLDTELPKDLESMSIKLKFVSVKGASVGGKQLKVSASNIIKNGKDSSQLTNQINAECVISLLGADQKVIAPSIIANYSGTEIRLNQSKENLSRMAILEDDTLKLRMADGFIRSLLSMYSAENCEKVRLYITLTLINTIILKATYMCVSQTPIICKFTGSLKTLQGNSLEMELSSLEMASITETSNANRYKMLGNGWTVDVIAHIFRSMRIK
jgi:DNA-cytosine methyltransferase